MRSVGLFRLAILDEESLGFDSPQSAKSCVVINQLFLYVLLAMLGETVEFLRKMLKNIIICWNYHVRLANNSPI